MHGALPVPGDVVWIRRRRWRVERARRDRHVVRLDVAARDRKLTFLSPFDRVLARAGVPLPRHVRPQCALAVLASALAHTDDVRVPSAAVAARADILPHQLEPVMAVLQGRTRILLADEVGLGKTVQAGIVIAELLRRDLAHRVLILVPASLRHQWIDELADRFRIPSLSADRAGLDAMSQAGAFGDDPWRRAGVWIATPDFLKQRHVADALPRDPWDLVVIDEAHAVCGDSERYELCQSLAGYARRTLLLTATPHSGDDTRFSRLVALGQSSSDDAPIVVFRRTRASLGQRPARRVRWHRVTLSDAGTRTIDALRAFERMVVARSKGDQPILLLSVFRKRALSTMSALAQSLARRLAWLGELGPGAPPNEPAGLEWAQPRLDFDMDEDDGAREEREGLTAHTGLALRQERSWLRRLRALAEEAARDDRKVERLAALIQRSTEPVVVFTEFRDSLDAIAKRLRFIRPLSVLHGGQDFAVRRHQLQQFQDGITSVLLATDVAGQGLNLQARARWVISFELPWNPARLEQRIGRVDRISQTRSTHLTLLVARDEAEAGLLMHLSRRVFAARQALGDDALAGVLPPEPAVRAALFGGVEPPERTAAAAPPACVRWARLARRAAVILARQRSLASRWKTDGLGITGAVMTDHGRAQRLIPRGFGSVLVFSVPILNGDDALIERRIVAIAVSATAGDARRALALAAVAKPAAIESCRRRVAMVTRWTRSAIEAAGSRERALASLVREEMALDEVQPGLFDLKEVRAFDVRQADAERRADASDREVDRLGRLHQIRAGEPVLEVVLTRRP